MREREEWDVESTVLCLVVVLRTEGTGCDVLERVVLDSFVRFDGGDDEVRVGVRVDVSMVCVVRAMASA